MKKKEKRTEKEKKFRPQEQHDIKKFPLNIPSGFEYIYVNILIIVCLFLHKNRYIYRKIYTVIINKMNRIIIRLEL